MFTVSKSSIKHDKLCLGSHGNSVILTRCLSSSSDQHWEIATRKQIKHKYVNLYTIPILKAGPCNCYVYCTVHEAPKCNYVSNMESLSILVSKVSWSQLGVHINSGQFRCG